MKYLISLFIFLTFISQNLISKTLLEQAEEIAKQVSKDLPYRTTENTTMMSISNYKEIVSIFIVIHGNRVELKKYSEDSGVSLNYLKEVWKDYTKNSICSPQNKIGNFIRQGGKVKYLYDFSDGERFMINIINKC